MTTVLTPTLRGSNAAEVISSPFVEEAHGQIKTLRSFQSRSRVSISWKHKFSVFFAPPALQVNKKNLGKTLLLSENHFQSRAVCGNFMKEAFHCNREVKRMEWRDWRHSWMVFVEILKHPGQDNPQSYSLYEVLERHYKDLCRRDVVCRSDAGWIACKSTVSPLDSARLKSII